MSAGYCMQISYINKKVNTCGYLHTRCVTNEKEAMFDNSPLILINYSRQVTMYHTKMYFMDFTSVKNALRSNKRFLSTSVLLDDY